MPLRGRQLLSNEYILLLGTGNDTVRSVGYTRLPTRRQLICGAQAPDGMLTGRSDEGIAVLALNLHRHDDGEHKLLNDGAHEKAGYFRLTCRESPLHSFRNRRPWQRLAERHPGIHELLHIAVDEHDVAALAQN